MIDRVFGSLGRIRRASGTTSKEVFTDVNSILTAMWDAGRMDYIVGVRDGTIKPIHHVHLYRQGGIRAIPSAERLPRLDTVYDWIKTYQASAKHRVTLRTTYKALLALEPNALVEHLPDLLRRLKQQRSGWSFRADKAAVLAYLNDTLGRSHELYVRCSEIKLLPRIRNRLPVHLTPAEAKKAFDTLPVAHRRHAWALILTGMRPDEYFLRKFEVLDHGVRIDGTKTASSKRIVPNLGMITTPTTLYPPFQKAMKKYVDWLQPYDCRHSYSLWLEQAGIEASRVSSYMGHGPKSQTEHYQRHVVGPHLAGDSRKLLKLLDGAQIHLRVG